MRGIIIPVVAEVIIFIFHFNRNKVIHLSEVLIMSNGNIIILVHSVISLI